MPSALRQCAGGIPCSSDFGLGRVAWFGHRNVSRHEEVEGLNVLALLCLASCSSAACNDKEHVLE